MFFSYIVDDRIIYSWCLNFLNIQFNEFRYIRCFDQNLESLSTSKLFKMILSSRMYEKIYFIGFS